MRGSIVTDPKAGLTETAHGELRSKVEQLYSNILMSRTHSISIWHFESTLTVGVRFDSKLFFMDHINDKVI